ncbi:NUDIX hydrolase [Chroogloeocystis siderophila]|jgi:ADP-ribose pyrophosphatase|uniref:NUDIX hydrolase n=1 Tax=Chroogloeocystis siderophila 5.2 s.c.1 TaxID=247279 RepID=A0A1U7HLB5_9CHRO|nr:NUDIX hydrolase [Chroogloeocystis siderophila]OKH24359.1 NUDIX hydrolase [Chroogloeocystis siderophila 5.2 s.c.1]
MDLKEWKILSSRMVIDNQWCKVRQDEIELPNGKIIDDYFINIRLDVALILPITSNQEIIFVRQYRHGAGEILLELPAGTFDTQLEDPQVAALRELKEETGYIAKTTIPLGILYDNPVKDSNKIYLFLAQDATKAGQQELDPTEEIEVILIPVSKVMEKIAIGEINVAGTVSAIFMGLNYLNNLHLTHKI